LAPASEELAVKIKPEAGGGLVNDEVVLALA
jgi:hypothetical protein